MSWQFDEIAHGGAEHPDAGYVAAFDTKAGTDWTEEVAVLLAAGIGTTSTIVDLGASTGTFAQAIAEHAARVIRSTSPVRWSRRCAAAGWKRSAADSSTINATASLQTRCSAPAPCTIFPISGKRSAAADRPPAGARRGATTAGPRLPLRAR